MTAPLEPLHRSNLPASIAQRLRRQISDGHLKPGERLPGHRELASIFDVSVGSVREAISMLVSEGLILTQAGRGTFVTDGDQVLPAMLASSTLDRKKVVELIEAREILESQIAVWAAERATPDQIKRLRSIIDRMQTGAADPDVFLEADVDLHLALAEAADNRYLLRTMGNIRTMLRRDLELGTEVGFRRHGNLQFSVDKHRRLVEAVEARDPKAARDAIMEVIADNREFVIGMYTHATLETE